MNRCNLCGNQDYHLMTHRNGKEYCKACLPYQLPIARFTTSLHSHHCLSLRFELTSAQKKLSEHLIKKCHEKKHTVVHAICGAGKTEIVAPVILETLNSNGRVGFATPRRSLVIDIVRRFQLMFPYTRIAGVYGGHTSNLEGDIIVFTTHQSMRYNRAFDLLIIDEVDAYPYANNPVLIRLTEATTKQSIIKLSATPNILEYRSSVVYQLNERPHQHQQIAPEIVVCHKVLAFIKMWRLIKSWQQEKRSILIFVPSKVEGQWIANILSILRMKCVAVSASLPHTEYLYEHLRNKTPLLATTTTVLERGITIPNVQVLVWNANHPVFTLSVLVQIAGRVGRVAPFYNGQVVFMANEMSGAMQECKKIIQTQNQSVHNVGLPI